MGLHCVASVILRQQLLIYLFLHGLLGRAVGDALKCKMVLYLDAGASTTCHRPCQTLIRVRRLGSSFPLLGPGASFFGVSPGTP